MGNLETFIQTNHIQAFVFDIDDTLYLERDYVRSGFRAIGRALSHEAFGKYCWQLFEAGVRGDTFNRALARYPEVDASIPQLVELYRTHKPQIALCPDALELLTNLRARTAVITDGPLASQRQKFFALGLLPWIECPIFTQEFGIAKPKPAPYQLAALTLDTPFERCVYIGDNPAKDFAGAHAVGYKTIRVRRPGALHFDTPSDNDVDLEVRDLSL
ncbi:MAG: HAD family hydrolase [Proteobacteria bacterium]|nr:HAD family hydrolase [Pseudomonadota bacterium]